MYQRLAELCHFNLRDNEQAVVWHKEVLRLNPLERQSLQYCVDHFSEREDWRGLVSVYEAALRTRQRGGDEAAMLIQIAMILWRKLSDYKAAEGYFRRIKLNQPKHPLMLQFYTEFFEEKQDYRRLLNVLTARQTATDDPEQKLALGRQMAEVAETNIGNPEKAIDIWKALLKLDPGLDEARQALMRLYRAASKWNALLEFFKEDLQNAAPEASISILTEMVEIYRDRLKLPVMVANVYHQILELEPTNESALDALEERYRAGNRWNDLVMILSRRAERHLEDGRIDEHVEVCREMATIWQDRFSNRQRACECLESILEHKPGDLDTLRALVALYKADKDWSSLVDTYARLLPDVSDSEKKSILQEMAEICLKRLDRLDDGIDFTRQIVQLDPEDSDAWSALETALDASARWEDLVELYEERVVNSPEDDHVHWLLKVAQVSLDNLNDEGRAIQAWRSVLERNSEHADAAEHLTAIYVRDRDWVALEDLYGRRNQWQELVGLFSTAAETAVDAVERVELYEGMARICGEELKDPDAETACWSRVFEVDPDHGQAGAFLMTRYEATENWDALTEVMEVTLGREDNPSLSDILRLATIYSERLEAWGSAFDWSARALSREPGRLDVLERVKHSAAQAQKEPALMALLEELVEDSGEAQAQYLRILARLSSEVSQDDEQAAAHYERLVEAGLGDAEVLEELSSIYERLGRWTEMLAVYERRLDGVRGSAEEIKIHGLMGRLYADVLEDVEKAAEAFEAMRDLDGNNLEALHGLQHLAQAAEDHERFIEYLEAEIALTDEPAQQAALRVRLGRLLEQTGDVSQALTQFASALGLVPNHEEADAALWGHISGDMADEAAELLEPHLRDIEDYERLVLVLAHQTSGDKTDQTTQDRRIELGHIRLDRLNDEAGAFDAFLTSVRMGSAEEGVLDILERLAAQLGRWPEVADEYEQQTFGGERFVGVAEQAASVGLRLARVLEHEISDVPRARAIWAVLLDELGDTPNTWRPRSVLPFKRKIGPVLLPSLNAHSSCQTNQASDWTYFGRLRVYRKMYSMMGEQR